MIDGNPLHPDLALAVAAGRRDRRHADGREPRLPHGLPQGGRASRRRSSTCRGCGRSARRAARCRRRATAGSPSSSAPRCCSTWAAAAPTSAPGSCRAARCCRCGPGRSPGRCLGVDAKAFDDDGDAGRRRAGRAGDHRADAVDAGRLLGRRRRQRATGPPTSTTIPGVWRHGDWVRFSERRQLRHHRPLGRHPQPRRRAPGHRRVLPRGRGGARGRRQPGRAPRGPGRRTGRAAAVRACWATASRSTTRCAGAIATALRTTLSPRHVPDRIVAVPAIPHNRTGKKLELPVKKILRGARPTTWPAATRSPTRPSLDVFVDSYRGRASDRGPAPVAVRVGTGVIGAELGGALPRPRPGRRRHRPGARCASERLRADVDDAWPALTGSAWPTGPRPSRLTFTADPAEAVADGRLRAGERAGADGPQARAVRRAGRGAPRRTSCWRPARPGCCRRVIARRLRRAPRAGADRAPVQPAAPDPAGRGGAAASAPRAAAVERRWRSTRAVGKRPIRVRQEVPGPCRQPAAGRAVAGGVLPGRAGRGLGRGHRHRHLARPGLRWALLGPFVNQHLSGGPGGMAHDLEHLGPPTGGLVARPARSPR